MLLEVQHIRKAFPNGTRALNDVSFSVDAGEFVSVIGPSGAGKTTLFRILNGALLCDAGEILVTGVHFEAAGRRQRRSNPEMDPVHGRCRRRRQKRRRPA